MMPDLPSGTVTFLFSDIEDSTALWERDRATMAAAVAIHIVLLDSAIQTLDGVHFKAVDDAVQAAFPSAPDAVAAARIVFVSAMTLGQELQAIAASDMHLSVGLMCE